MNTGDRIKRIREIEKNAERLVKKGWRLESVEHTDERNEPFRTTIKLSVEGESALGGKL